MMGLLLALSTISNLVFIPGLLVAGLVWAICGLKYGLFASLLDWGAGYQQIINSINAINSLITQTANPFIGSLAPRCLEVQRYRMYGCLSLLSQMRVTTNQLDIIGIAAFIIVTFLVTCALSWICKKRLVKIFERYLPGLIKK